MKFKIIASVVTLIILIILYVLFSGGTTETEEGATETQTEVQ